MVTEYRIVKIILKWRTGFGNVLKSFFDDAPFFKKTFAN